MAGKIREPGLIACCWSNTAALQNPPSLVGSDDRDAQAEIRGAVAPLRDVHDAQAAMQYPGKPTRQKGGMMPNWLRMIIRIWRGELIEQERRRSKQLTEEARKTLDQTRAMLDGEDNWLIPPERCQGNEK